MSTSIRRILWCVCILCVPLGLYACSSSSHTDSPSETRQNALKAAGVKVTVLDSSGNPLASNDVLTTRYADVLIQLDSSVEGYDVLSLRLGTKEVQQWQNGSAPTKLVAKHVDFQDADASGAPAKLEAIVFQGGKAAYAGWDMRVVDTRMAGLKRLRDTGGSASTVRWDGDIARSVITDYPTTGSTEIERVENFVTAFPEFFRFLQDGAFEEQFVPRRVKQVGEARYAVNFEQHLMGVPVYGSYINGVIQQDQLVSVKSNYVSDLNSMKDALNEAFNRRNQGELPAKEALDALTAWLHNRYGITEVYEAGEHRLMLIDARLLSGASFEGTHVAWRVSVEAKDPASGQIQYWTAFVDLASQQVLYTLTSANGRVAPQGYYGVNVQDAKGNDSGGGDWNNCFAENFLHDGAPTVCWGQDGDPSTDCNGSADTDAQNFVTHSAEWDSFLMDWFNIDVPQNPSGGTPFFNSGTGTWEPAYPAVVNVKLPTHPTWIAQWSYTCDNAQFLPSYTGSGTVFHELTHQLTAKLGGFSSTPGSQPKALAEHYAMVFSEIVNNYFGYTSGFAPPAGINNRSQLAGLSDEHNKAELMNKVFRLVVNGGSNNGYVFNSPHLTLQEVAELMFATRQDGNVGFHSSFQDYRDGIVAEARTNWGLGLSEHKICLLETAFASAGYDDPSLVDHDCDGIPDYDDGDNDGDGAPNGRDNCPNYANPNQRDTDADGIGNMCDDDIDGDGMPNNPALGPVDVCPNAAPIPASATDRYALPATSTHRDFDGDGEPDACSDGDGDGVDGADDTCPYTYDPDQKDTDGDGKGDGCDDDQDNDGVLDTYDNCLNVPNANQADFDSDGKGDACDDDDHDHVLDVGDNCLGIYNPDQQDFDNDGIGDDCDSDIDNDGRANADDECPYHYSPTREADSDGDGAGDSCDNCPGYYNPAQYDPDGDGLGNACDWDDDNDNIPDDHNGGYKPGNDPCTNGQTTNCDDNCPNTPNPDQQDTNGNGVGIACSAAAQPGFRQWTHNVDRYMSFMRNFKEFPKRPSELNTVPTPPCTPQSCGPDPMPEIFDRSVELTAPYPFRSVVLDDTGAIIQGRTAEYDSSAGDFTATLTWKPGVGSRYPSKYAYYGVIRTDAYSVRVVPTNTASAKEPAEVVMKHKVIVP